MLSVDRNGFVTVLMIPAWLNMVKVRQLIQYSWIIHVHIHTLAKLQRSAPERKTTRQHLKFPATVLCSTVGPSGAILKPRHSITNL